MQFTLRKRRQTPSVIIVSLIDVLIVVLIFLMVSTTFKKQPSLSLALAESSQAKKGTAAETDSVIVTIPKSGPFYFKQNPVTYETLEKRLKEAVGANPEVTLIINEDSDATWGQMVKVQDAAKAANIKHLIAPVKPPTDK